MKLDEIQKRFETLPINEQMSFADTIYQEIENCLHLVEKGRLENFESDGSYEDDAEVMDHFTKEEILAVCEKYPELLVSHIDTFELKQWLDSELLIDESTTYEIEKSKEI